MKLDWLIIPVVVLPFDFALVLQRSVGSILNSYTVKEQSLL